MQRFVLGLTLCLLSAPAFGDEVTVKNMHLCCGSCVKAVDSALGKVKGLSDIKIDKDAGTVVFQAENAKSARTAVKDLAKAGFAGKATSNGEKVSLPKIDVEKGTTSNSFEVKGVHLCCGGCIKGVQEALKDVKGITSVSGDKETGIVKIDGDDVDVRGVIKAMRKAGFNGAASLESK